MEALLGAMRMAEHAGAKAFAINFAALGPDGWSREAMRRIFSFTPRPCMPYTYRGHHLSGAPDEKRAELQLQAAEEGAAGSDLMGDLFDPSPRELTLKPEAIRRQMRLIDELHQRGSEVLLHLVSPEAGRKIATLRRNDRVCLEIDLPACAWMDTVLAEGRATAGMAEPGRAVEVVVSVERLSGRRYFVQMT